MCFADAHTEAFRVTLNCPYVLENRLRNPMVKMHVSPFQIGKNVIDRI
jgi:hypothetical protein